MRGTTRLINTDLITLTIKLQELNTALDDVRERIRTLLWSPGSASAESNGIDGLESRS